MYIGEGVPYVRRGGGYPTYIGEGGVPYVHRGGGYPMYIGEGGTLCTWRH